MDIKPEITWSDFEKIDMRVGTIISAVVFEKARKPAYQLEIDFGDLGIRKSSAQITDLYNTETLVGQQIIAVVNFPKTNSQLFSECLVLGIVGTNQVITLLQPEQKTTNGLPIA